MKSTLALILAGTLMGVAVSATGPVAAKDTRPQYPSLRDTNSAGLEMSSRHRYSRIVASGRLAPQYTYAPIAHKVFGDPRWPYVHWRGSHDSLYAPGPLVTFVRYY